MSGPCKYSNLFGEPGEGVHSIRLGGLALVDLLATGGLAYLGSRYVLGRADVLMIVLVFIVLMLAAVLIHEGPYDTIGNSYELIGRWMSENELHIAGSVREAYLVAPDDPNGPITELRIPVE